MSKSKQVGAENLKRINAKRAEHKAKSEAFDAYQLKQATPPSKEQVEDMYDRWRFHPEQYVYEYMRIDKAITPRDLTSQQRSALMDLGKMVRYNFGKNALDRKDITELPAHVAEFGYHIGLSCSAGIGVGKDATAAIIIMWMLDVMPPNTKIFCLAPRQEHLKTVLWPEVRNWATLRMASGEFCYLGKDTLQLEAEQISHLNAKGEKESFCSQLVIPKTTDVKEMEAMMAGKHADNMMFIFDEASAIADAVVEPIENTLTGMNNFAVAIYNPRKNKGWAVKTQEPASKWIKHRWSQEDCELISKEQLARMEEKYGGRDTDGYRVNVLGLPPSGGSEDVLIPFVCIQDALDAEKMEQNTAPRFLGVDVAAGKGIDGTDCVIRQGYCIERIIHLGNKMDTVDSEDAICEIIENDGIDAVFIDEIGVGKGVYDRVRRRFKATYGVATSRTTDCGTRFHKLRDKLLWDLREYFMSGFVTMPMDDKLVTELADIKFDSSSGKIKVEDKHSMRRRLGGSPDSLEALYLTFFKREAFFRGDRLGSPAGDIDMYRRLDRIGKLNTSKTTGWLAR